jgi:hypothetical protein
MSKLGTPAAVTLMSLALGAAISPDLPLLGLGRVAGGIVAGLSALFVVALADRRTPRQLVALGAATLALALAYDSLRGERGSIRLGAGQGTRTFEETGPGGGRLGLHPFADAVILEGIEPDGTVVMAEQDAGRRVRVTPRRAAPVAGYRLGDPRRVPGSGTRVLLRVAGGADADVTLREGDTARAADLDITIERYFPDFAVEGQQPFSRSDEPRNPAALLQVRRGSSSWRVFVIRAMPGIHKPAGLDRTLTLVDVVPEEAIALAVSREPAALLAALGVLVAAVGVAWSRW